MAAPHAILLAAAGLALAAPTAAQEPEFQFTAARTEMADTTGARLTYARLVETAAAYCAQFEEAVRCSEEMVELAVEEIGEPMLTALHRARTPAATDVVTAAWSGEAAD